MLLSRSAHGINKDDCALLSEAGWQAVDVNDTMNAARYPQSEEDCLAFFTQATANIREAGLEIGQCHAPMPRCYGTTPEKEMEALVTAIERSVRVADTLRIPYIVVHPLVYSWDAPDPSPDRALEWNIRYLRRLCRHAEHTAVCLENMPGKGGFIRTGEDMARVLDAANIDSLMVCLDTGHLFCQQQKASDFFAHVGDRIRVTHIHDSVGEHDCHLLAGTGQGDWADFKAALKTYGYAGNLNSESGLFSAFAPAHLRLAGQVFERQVLASLMEE